MLISEACELTGLTKKAIRYYIEKGLLESNINENKYRNFLEEDIDKLKKIAFYRNLDLGISDIKKIFDGDENEELSRLLLLKKEKAEVDKVKISIMEKYISGNNEDALCMLNDMESRVAIGEKLLNSFPGYYGRYITLHFGNFLKDTIASDEQKEAYRIVVDFLDSVSIIEFPENVRIYIDNVSKEYNNDVLNDISQNYIKTFDQDFDLYWKNNKEFIEKYYEFKETDEYKYSESAEFYEFMKRFNKESGYYDIFIPAMKKLSPSYKIFLDKAERFSENFKDRFPEAFYKSENEKN